MTAVEKLIAVARNEIGYLEKKSNSNLHDKSANAGYNNYTKYAKELDEIRTYNGAKNGYAWCDVFTDWCFITAFGFENGLKLLCQPERSAGAGCEYSANYYKQKGQFHKSNPQPGDQIFFTNGNRMYHTGIVEKVENGRVFTIEGNTSSAAGVVENGGAVRNKSYSLNDKSIGGYGRPDYSIIKNEENNIKEDTKMIDDKTFKELFLRMRKTLQDNDSSEYSEEARQWAISTGLVVGSGTKTESNEPNYMWEDLLTREQLITVLYRFAKDNNLIK